MSRISRLPQYINVHFVRFFWKAKDGVKAKILRAVKFPMQLDVFNLCTEGLRGEMAETRRRLQEIQDRAMGHGAAKTAEVPWLIDRSVFLFFSVDVYVHFFFFLFN